MNAHRFTPPPMTEEEQKIYDHLLNYTYPEASEEMVYGIMQICQMHGLNPANRYFHSVPMWDSKAKREVERLMPGIMFFRAVSDKNGCIGVSEPEFGPNVTMKLGETTITFPEWCKVTVKKRTRTGEVAEYVHFERWLEAYSQRGKLPDPNPIWKKRPWGMLAKTTETGAHRKACPADLGAYSAEEMEGKSFGDMDEPVMNSQPADEFFVQKKEKEKERKAAPPAPAPMPEPEPEEAPEEFAPPPPESPKAAPPKAESPKAAPPKATGTIAPQDKVDKLFERIAALGDVTEFLEEAQMPPYTKGQPYPITMAQFRQLVTLFQEQLEKQGR